MASKKDKNKIVYQEPTAYITPSMQKAYDAAIKEQEEKAKREAAEKDNKAFRDYVNKK